MQIQNHRAPRRRRPAPSVPAHLSDVAWRQVQPLVGSMSRGPGRPFRDHRLVLDGILWVLATRTSWRSAPAWYGPWQTLYGRFRRWERDGTWTAIAAALETPH